MHKFSLSKLACMNVFGLSLLYVPDVDVSVGVTADNQIRLAGNAVDVTNAGLCWDFRTITD